MRPAARRNEVLALIAGGLRDFSVSRSRSRARGWGIEVPGDLTVDDRKISKSSGAGADPVELVGRHGTDAVRWWLLREVPLVGDLDFSEARLVARANEDLANGLGNLVSRVVAMVCRYRDGWVPVGPVADVSVREACEAAGRRVDAALAGYDFRAAAGAVWEVVVAANRYVERVRPWELAGAGDGRGLDVALATLVGACRVLAVELVPLLPGAAAGVAARCAGVRLAPAGPLFARLRTP